MNFTLQRPRPRRRPVQKVSSKAKYIMELRLRNGLAANEQGQVQGVNQEKHKDANLQVMAVVKIHPGNNTLSSRSVL